jgi:subtilisin family serine protease
MNTLLKKTALFAICGLFTSVLSAQDEIPHGWHMLDKAKTGYYGISTDKAYQFVKSKKLKSKTVIVAVIDSGVDTTHEDLKSILWRNPKEIPGNGIDDDKNGYVDDIYGWNFLGGKDGKSVEQDSYEAGRVYHNFKTKYDGKDITVSELSKEEQFEYEMWKRAKEEVAGEDSKTGALELMFMEKAFKNCLKSDSILRKAMGKETYTGKELGAFEPTESDAKKAKTTIYALMSGNDATESTNVEFLEGFGEYVDSEKKKADAANTPPKEYRNEIVGDDYDNFNDRFYGNNDVMVRDRKSVV